MRRLALGIGSFLTAIVAGSCSIDFEGHFTGVDGDCAGATCVPIVPEGFQGPVSIARGEPCPEGSTEVESGTLCGACACAGAVSCGATELQLFGNGCTDPPDATAPVGSGGCVDVNVSGGLLFARATERAPTPQCEASGGGAEAVKLCALEAGDGCAEGSVCVSAEDRTVCVVRAGDWDCPAEYPIEAHLGSASDACAACTCEVPPAACASVVDVFMTSGCAGSAAEVAADGVTCAPLSDAAQSVRATAPSPGDCRPAGGVPEGSASAMTVCCR